MTAPDDLARVRQQHPFSILDTEVYCGKCGVPWMSTAHLASVVSRRDTDLQTRIEKLADEFAGRAIAAAKRYGDDRNLEYLGASRAYDKAVTDLLTSLDADTREDAPAHQYGYGGHATEPGQRPPADTDQAAGSES